MRLIEYVPDRGVGVWDDSSDPFSVRAERLPDTVVIVWTFAQWPCRAERPREQEQTFEADHRCLGPLETRDHALTDARQVGQPLLAQAGDLPCAAQVPAETYERCWVIQAR